MIVAIQHERVPTSHKDSRDNDEILLPGIAIVFGASLDRSGCSKYLVSVDDAVDLPRSSHTDPSCCVGKNQLVHQGFVITIHTTQDTWNIQTVLFVIHSVTIGIAN